MLRIAPTADGCRVTESFRIVCPPGAVGRWLTKVATGVPWSQRTDDLVGGMLTTLERLKQTCETTSTAARESDHSPHA